jgi:hypothetical protein
MARGDQNGTVRRYTRRCTTGTDDSAGDGTVDAGPDEPTLGTAVGGNTTTGMERRASDDEVTLGIPGEGTLGDR